MRCEECGLELQIASSFIDARLGEKGGIEVYSVADLKCVNDNCSKGRSGVPVKRVSRLIENRGNGEATVSCCGAPLLYTSKESYFLPKGIEGRLSFGGGELSVTCPVCKKTYLASVQGKARTE